MGKTKLTYADPKLEIWICKDDVITSSGDLQAAYDDTVQYLQDVRLSMLLHSGILQQYLYQCIPSYTKESHLSP